MLCGMGLRTLDAIGRIAESWPGGVESDSESGWDDGEGKEVGIEFVGVDESESALVQIGHMAGRGGSGSLAGGVHSGVSRSVWDLAFNLFSFESEGVVRSASHTRCPKAITAFSMASCARDMSPG